MLHVDSYISCIAAAYRYWLNYSDILCRAKNFGNKLVKMVQNSVKTKRLSLISTAKIHYRSDQNLA